VLNKDVKVPLQEAELVGTSSSNNGDKNNIDSQKVQKESLHSDTNEQPSDLQGDGGTTAAELPPP
jgi:hypothetical protein